MNEKGCEHDLILQRFLDEELHPEAAEMVFFHIENCSSCGGRLQKLKAVKAFCRDELGREDEFEGEFTQKTLLHVRSRLHSRGGAVAPRHSANAIGRIASFFDWLRLRLAGSVVRWRIATLATALFVIVTGLAVWFAILPSSNISASEILSESERRTWIWESQPGKVLYWGYDANLVNRPGISDGRYYSFHWQDNTRGERSRLNRRYNADGVLTWASWVRADGSKVVYERLPYEHITIYPTTDVLRAYAVSLDENSKKILELYIERSTRSVQTEPEMNSEVKRKILYKPLSEGNVQIIESADAGKIFRIQSTGFEGKDKSVRVDRETDFVADTFMRKRIRVVRFYPDGKTGIEESEMKFYQESSIEDFNANDLSAEMRKVKRIIQVTPEEVLGIAKRLEETKRSN